MLAFDQILQGRYRIVRQLGHGGMGAVYEAIDERFGEPIALKEIIVDSVNEKQKDIVTKAFEREAKSLAKAKHESVPFVRDYFFELDRQFLVMELVEGDDLGKMLEIRKAPFLLEDIVNWMDQLLDALDYLHNLKPPIIHRDIKPQNLKLSSRRRIKLLDFGIARSTDKSTTITKQTFVGATLNYSPIEQILRVIDQTFREFIVLKHKEKAEAVLSQDTDARCDIYALGGTFYHLLTNHEPIDATKRTLDIWEGKNDPLPHPTALNPQIPLPIANCLLKAMAIERDHRYSSAFEMKEALKNSVLELNDILNSGQKRTMEETLRMISGEHLKIEKPTEILSPNSSPTFLVDIPVSETKPPTVDTFQPDSSFGKSGETKPSGNISSSDLTAPSYLINVPVKEKSKESVKPVVSETHADSGSINKLLWLIPIAFIGLLGVGGIGGFIWLMIPSSNSSASNKAVTNQVMTTPTPAPESPIPVSSATIEPTVEPTVVQKNTPVSTPNQSKPEPAKTVAVTVPNKTPVSAPVKTQQPKKNPKPTQDPNCIFTNSCK